MNKNPHTEDDSIRQTPKSLCRTSLARSLQITQIIQQNQNIKYDNEEISDKISSNSMSSDNNDDLISESNFQFNQQHNIIKTSSPHLSSLKRSQNLTNFESSSLQQISHPNNTTAYSLKRNNELIPNENQIEFSAAQEINYNQSFAKNNEYPPIQVDINSDNNDSISNDGSYSDTFESDGLQRTQTDRNDPIQTDDHFWSQETHNKNNSSSTEQIETDDVDDNIENEMEQRNRKDLYENDDAIEEASSNHESDDHSFLQSDSISENESDDQFNGLTEEIDSTVHSQFFKQQNVVFEFINDETDELDAWNFEYMRVIYAKTIDSQIEELTENSYRILARKCDTAHIRKKGDNFVLGVPYYIYAHDGKIYLIAPNISDKL